MKHLIKRFLGLLNPREYLLDTMPADSICAEIGCWKGDFSQQILKLSNPNKLYLIDPYKYVSEYDDSWYGGNKINQRELDGVYNYVLDRFREHIKSGKVISVRKESSEASDMFPDDFFDWIYIDGDHTYTAVLSDIQKYYYKVKPGGYICGDDYGVEGWWEDGVTRAFDFFVSENKDKIRKIKVIGSQIILRKINGPTT